MAETLNAAGAAIDEALFAALFACSLTPDLGEAEAPNEETRPEEEKDEGTQAAPVVVTGFTVPVVWPALEAALLNEPAVVLCVDWKSSSPEAPAELVEPVLPKSTDPQSSLPESLVVSLQAEPGAKGELAFAARLQAEPVAKTELAFAARPQAEPVAKAELAFAAQLQAEPVAKTEMASTARLDAEPVAKAELAVTARLDAEPVAKAELPFVTPLQAEPAARAESASTTRLEATESRLPPRDPQRASALEVPQTVPQPEVDRKPASGVIVRPPEEVAPQSGNRIALSTSQPKPEPAGELPQPASPDRQPARLDREPVRADELPQPASPDRRPAPRERELIETRSATPERLPQRRAAVEAAASPNLPPVGSGAWEPPPVFQRAAPAPGSTREPPTAPSEPSTAPRSEPKPEAVRDLALVIPGRVSEGKKEDSIQVRLTDRAGEVRVAVHTGDSELAHSLRGQLGELVTRLEQTGYRTQTWQPAEISAGAARTGDGRGPEGQETSTGFGRGNSNWGGQEPRQQQPDSQDQPEWVKSLAGAGIKQFLAGME